MPCHNFCKPSSDQYIRNASDLIQTTEDRLLKLRDDAYLHYANTEFVQKRLCKKKKMPGEHSSDDPISNPESRFKVDVL